MGGIPSPRKSLETLKRLADAYDVPLYSNNYKDLINNPDIDIIAIYTPDKLHREACIAALDAGKHVICTKPMTDSLEDAIDIVKKVDETGLKFLIGQTIRFEPQFASLKKLYDDGDLGDIFAISGQYVHDSRSVYLETPWRKNMPQDPMYGGICHPIDAMRWFCGDVESVHCVANKANLIPDLKPDYLNFLLLLKFKSGVIGSVRCMYDLVHPPLPMMEIDVFGRRVRLLQNSRTSSPVNLKDDPPPFLFNH
ncbi:MAG: Gfo/Idh/MocA family oxidoreductase [Eubacteriales bacterium]|nr:Gfo/Idh/MocA family oxidoreductase [Eubacteriales bacterium]